MTLQEIKKNLDNDNLIIGYDKTLKNLKLGKISKVYLSVNCPDEIKEDVKRYANINKTDVEILKKNNFSRNYSSSNIIWFCIMIFN